MMARLRRIPTNHPGKFSSSFENSWYSEAGNFSGPKASMLVFKGVLVAYVEKCDWETSCSRLEAQSHAAEAHRFIAAS